MKRLILASVLLVSTSLSVRAQWSDWLAPESSKNNASTIELDNPEIIANGKDLYGTICFLCHGPEGKGDGPQAPALTPKPADFTSIKVQQQSDGELFWKITNGRPPMMSFAHFTEEQRWSLVAYLRDIGSEALAQVDANSTEDERSVLGNMFFNIIDFDTTEDVQLALLGTVLLFLSFILIALLLVIKTLLGFLKG